jgi:hypothetical protein
MTAHATAELFRRIDPIWCDPPMVDLPVVWCNDAWETTSQRLSATSWTESVSGDLGTADGFRTMILRMKGGLGELDRRSVSLSAARR